MRVPPPRSTRRRVRVRVGGAALGLALLAAACTGDGGSSPAPTTSIDTTTTTLLEREDDGRLLIGVYLPITGEGSELGQPMIAAIDDAVAEINAAGGVLGDDVRTVQADEGLGTGLGDLLDEGVDAIIGPASSITALSQLAPAVDPASGVVICSPSATSLALDDYPDANFLFRTVPSDSLQMAAIARQVQRTGARSVAVGYLDDPYGRGLHDAFLAELAARRLPVSESVGFSGDQSDLSGRAAELLEGDPGAIVVVNDAIRAARTTIQSLSDEFRERLTGVAPLARGLDEDSTLGFFAAHAVDCVNLIALAATVANSDAPRSFRTNMVSVSADGSPCRGFDPCVRLLADGLNIDYDGLSGSADLANSTGDPARARFESFGFDDVGAEVRSFDFTVP